MAETPALAAALLAWRRRHGRKGLPWQDTRDPYRVWLSEVMLQQTRVPTVLEYYPRFLERFPDVQALATAPVGDVLRLWAGLGYYARARNLHLCARAVVKLHGGRFPATADELRELPGIGRSTAAAISAFCNSERVAILDANARRVVARLFAVEGDARSAAVERALWERAHSLLPPARQMSAFTQAIMDLGAGPCAARRPDCEACPVQSHCQAFAAGRTAEIPAPRVTRARATRQAQVLVVLHRGRVLLEERPASGIWGGLLAPPQFASEAALRKAASGWSTRPPESLPVRRHEFTHFVLEFTPQVVRVRSAGSPLAGARWVSLSRIEGEALPSPMFRLLRDLRP